MTGSRPTRALGAAALALLLGWQFGATAQELSRFGAATGALEINAERGIEWRRSEKLYIARGNARAKRGDLTVYGDVLTAHYRAAANGDTEIFRVDAEGHVRLVSPGETATGDTGLYDVDQGLLVLRGDDLRLVTTEHVIEARDTLEYWERQQVAVARGDASAVRGDRQVRAEVLTAYFQRNAQDELELSSMTADGNVRVSTPREFAQGDGGVYYVKQQLATLTGDVRITRGEDQLNGAYAEMNLDTGISRVFGEQPGEPGDGRVRGLLSPEPKTADDGGS